MQTKVILVAAVLGQLGAALPARGYPVQNSATLDELTRQADLIVKARAVATRTVEDAWFDNLPGFAAHATGMEVLSVFKGDQALKTISFHHYDKLPGDVAMMYMPQHYRFTPGRSYVVFAKKTAEPGVFRQLWKQHRSKEDQGVLLAADERAHRGKSVADLYWAELTGLLRSKTTDDAVYAIRQLDWMSGGSYEELKHFDRRRVLAAMHGLISSRNQAIAAEAIRAVGSRNPYLSDEYAPHWLATIGEGDIPGFAEWDLSRENLGAQLHWKKLAAVVDSDAPLANRALAARALGRSKRPAVLALARRWLSDSAPEVRQAAALLLADFPDRVDTRLLESLARDPSPVARVGAARAIGFGRFEKLLPVLERLLGDRDPAVTRAAALSLLSFPVRLSGGILKGSLETSPYAPLFVNALARETPEPYLAALGNIVRKGLRPDNWWGGKIPWGTSWEILFRYVQQQPAENLKSGSLDAVLDSLESPLDRSQPGGGFYSSSEPRDLYALYLQRGLRDRARAFRAACKRVITYDIDYYFDMVDQSPSTYQRR